MASISSSLLGLERGVLVLFRSKSGFFVNNTTVFFCPFSLQQHMKHVVYFFPPVLTVLGVLDFYVSLCLSKILSQTSLPANSRESGQMRVPSTPIFWIKEKGMICIKFALNLSFLLGDPIKVELRFLNNGQILFMVSRGHFVHCDLKIVAVACNCRSGVQLSLCLQLCWKFSLWIPQCVLSEFRLDAGQSSKSNPWPRTNRHIQERFDPHDCLQ